MDLREIQALHAQYTAQPVIIDMASHTAAMPALPEPHRGPTARARAVELAAGLRKAGKPALVALAVVAVAAGAGISSARVWRAMHETVAAPAVVASAAKHIAVPTSEASDGRPIDAAPPRPLTSSDFDSGKPVTQSALSNVDARALAGTPHSSTTDAAAQSARPAAENAAAASPIRPQRLTVPAAPATTAAASASTPPESQARSQPAPPPVAAPSQAQAKVPVATPAQDATSPETRAPLRTIRRITHHTAAPANNEASPQPAASVQPKAQPGKSGDVQLF